MKKLILVTGGTGYIGSHTTVELIEAGYDVVIVDNLSNSSIDSLNGIKQITGTMPQFENFDLCDKEKLGDFFKKYRGIEAIIHFAALKAVGESVEKPIEYYSNNITSLLNLLMAMRNSISQTLFFRLHD
ncbi:MAG: NAD-dependent epimerase/dehydratase family protein, partial [Bacteroidales bacterium]|nr:NAD-dependent epimerase/dehydratase family protein [Bacteroidales bacterium]